MDKNEVNEAFEILLEEIEAVANALNEEGAQAFRACDYSKAKSAIEEATRLAEFREKVKGLQKEWVGLFASEPRARKEKGRRRSRARLTRGLPTPEGLLPAPHNGNAGGTGRQRAYRRSPEPSRAKDERRPERVRP